MIDGSWKDELRGIHGEPRSISLDPGSTPSRRASLITSWPDQRPPFRPAAPHCLIIRSPILISPTQSWSPTRPDSDSLPPSALGSPSQGVLIRKSALLISTTCDQQFWHPIEMFSLSIVPLISTLWLCQIKISYQTIEKRFWRLIGIFSLFLKGFLSSALSWTGHSSLSVFSHFLGREEKQNRNRKTRARVKQPAITGETPKINYTGPAANSPGFLCNQLHQWARTQGWKEAGKQTMISNKY